MCPAISIDPSDGKAQIAPELCVGCGVCSQLCGWKAIKSTATLQGGENKAYMELEDYHELQKVIQGKGKGKDNGNGKSKSKGKSKGKGSAKKGGDA